VPLSETQKNDKIAQFRPRWTIKTRWAEEKCEQKILAKLSGKTRQLTSFCLPFRKSESSSVFFTSTAAVKK
jgi:hypothetical protein